MCAAALRLILLDARELFRDEGASWLLAQSAWSDIIPRSSVEPYPPLFAFALKACIGILGDGEAALRMTSAISGVAMVAVTWAWAREALGTRAAYLAAGLVALSPLAIANSREARMYSLEAFFVTLAWWLTWRLLAGRTSPALRPLTVGVAALAVAGELWTQPTGLAAFALQAGTVGLLAARGGPGTRAAAIGLGLGLATFLPWIPRILALAAGGGTFWTPSPDVPGLLATLAVAFGGWQASPGWIAVAPLAVLAGIGFWSLSGDRSRHGAPTALAVAAGAAIILAWWLASFWRSAYDTRYLGAAVPPLAMAIAAGGASLAARWGRRGRAGIAIRVAAVTLMLMVAAGAMTFEARWVSGTGIAPARAAAEILRGEVRTGDVILVSDAESYFPLAYLLERESEPIVLQAPLLYWRSGTEPAFVGGDLVPADRTISPEVSLVPGDLPGLAPGGRIWLVAITYPETEVRGFSPLAAGDVVEVERLEVTDHGDGGLILVLRPNAE